MLRLWTLLLLVLSACATSQPVGEPVAEKSGPEPSGGDPAVAAVAIVNEKVRTERETRARAKSILKSDAVTIVIDCIVKLPDDPTDNPELCRGFRMEMLDDNGEVAGKFRFGTDARYRFAGRAGQKYRIRPVVGSNWEVTVTPNRDLVVGEQAKIQLRQKE